MKQQERFFRRRMREIVSAIRAVGLERDYEMILNTDAQAVPFLRPASVEDATPYVRQKLQ